MKNLRAGQLSGRVEDTLASGFVENMSLPGDKARALAKGIVAIYDTSVQSTNKLSDDVAKDVKDGGDIIGGAPVDRIMSGLFDLDGDFFKGEITRAAKFRELVVATNTILASGANPKTEKDWVKLGYSGQNVFEWGDKDELAVVNAFLAKARASTTMAGLIQYVSMHGNDEKSYRKVLIDLSNKKYAQAAKNENAGKMLADVNGVVAKPEKKEDAKSRIDLLANLSGDRSSGDIVSDEALKHAISAASNNGKNLDAVIQHVTGESIDWSDDRSVIAGVEKFQNALRFRLGVLRQISGNLNAGLDSMLQGKESAFLNAVTQYVQEKGKLEIKTSDPGMSTTMVNTLSAIGTVIVSVGTAGMVTVRPRGEHQVSAEDILAQLKQNPKLVGADKSVLEWLGNAFIGRRFALSIGNDTFADAFAQKILDHARSLMSITGETKPESIVDS